MKGRLSLSLVLRKGKHGQMDSSSENGDHHHLERAFQQDAAQYRVTYPRGKNTKKAVAHDNNEEHNKKRYPVNRTGNNPGRVKRVVSCKRKTHHLTVARRKQLGAGRTHDAANKENNEMNSAADMQQEIFEMDPWEFPLINTNNTGRTGSEQADCSTLSELTRDHSTMADVLFGRHLRLKVCLTLWRRNVGELLTYFLKIQDVSVVVDFLPLISKSIEEESPRITIDCCVDLFPLVKRVLAHPYEEYLIVGLKWIHAVLKTWWEELRTSGCSGPTKDANFQQFNRQLLELWHQEPLLKSVPGAAGDTAKVIDSFLSQLT